MRIEYLPPYSPDLNPIEEAFSAIKAHLRRHLHVLLAAMGEEDDLSVYLLLYEAVYSVTADDAYGWFSHSGYVHRQ
jgi:hypothetical protein